MPTYPLAFPSLHPAKVKAMHRRIQSVTQSPFSLKRQVFDWGAARWEISITMQVMPAVDAAVFGAFLENLNGLVGTFSFDLTPWCPGVSPAPGSRTFRLSNPSQSWDSDMASTWNFQIDAVEDV